MGPRIPDILHKNHPQCLLYIFHPATPNSGLAANSLSYLRASPCLFSLHVNFQSRQSQVFRELQEVVKSAPNLRDLTITSSPCGPRLEPDQKQWESERETEALHLRSLEVYNVFDPFVLPVEWSTLERLSMDESSLAPLSYPRLSGLKSFRLHRLRYEESQPPSFRLQRLLVEKSQSLFSLSSMLKYSKSLEVLDLTGYLSELRLEEDNLWESIGKSLVRLRLHQDDPEKRLRKSLDDSPYLSSTIMKRITRHCRNLRSLGLDLICDGQEWVCSSLRVCPSFNIKLISTIAIHNAQIHCG